LRSLSGFGGPDVVHAGRRTAAGAQRAAGERWCGAPGAPPSHRPQGRPAGRATLRSLSQRAGGLGAPRRRSQVLIRFLLNRVYRYLNIYQRKVLY
tara:strand:+ start:90 stop:374 length:285 start_codon:yes stop_codon:yes gene_type:complete